MYSHVPHVDVTGLELSPKLIPGVASFGGTAFDLKRSDNLEGGWDRR